MSKDFRTLEVFELIAYRLVKTAEETAGKTLMQTNISVSMGEIESCLRVHHNQQWVGYVEKCRL